MVKSAFRNAESVLETEENKPASFTVVDMMNNCVVLTGFFKKRNAGELNENYVF